MDCWKLHQLSAPASVSVRPKRDFLQGSKPVGWEVGWVSAPLNMPLFLHMVVALQAQRGKDILFSLSTFMSSGPNSLHLL